MKFDNRLVAGLLVSACLLAFGGCHQTWQFIPAEYASLDVSTSTQAMAETPSARSLASPADGSHTHSKAPKPLEDTFAQGNYALRHKPAGAPPGSNAQDITYMVSGPSSDIASHKGPFISTSFQQPVASACQPLPPVLDQSCDDLGCGTLGGEPSWNALHHCRGKLFEFRDDVCSDYRHYYTWPTLRDLALAVGFASPLANTSMDDNFQSWYQRDVRSNETDNFASFWKTFGEGKIFIPAFAGLTVVGKLLEHRPLFDGMGDYSGRVTRGYLVGAPPVIFMQALLGGSRPDEVTVGSAWKPFDDSNGVSGHAFMGAVPFITAAMMCENPWAKSTLYACSTFTAWSRVNDNDHYLSQVCLGWWMAYLACRSVDQTECEDRCYSFTPIATPEMSGIGMVMWR